jgi:flagellar hook-associated protein FlgK
VLMTRLREQQQGVSGVDVNEEMLEVMKFQQMFQSASKFISVVNDMYQQLFQSL